MIKELPHNWDTRPLSDVVDILDKKRIPVNAKERQQREGNVPYYGATGQVGWIDDYLFDEELVLLGEDGAPFLDFSKQKAYIVRGKSWVNNHAHVLKSRNGLPSSYIKYYLDTVDYRPFVTGTTRLKLNQAAMKKIPVPVAPDEYPKRIVEEIEKQFSRLDEAVANLKRVKANLKRYKASVLQAAVTGKLTEEWRQQHLPAPVTEPGKFYTYAILCEDESIYIGHTNDIERHWREHREGQGAEWTKEHKPVKIVHYEVFDSREEAAEREKWLKTGFGRKWITRELAAGRTRQAGDMEPASKLLERTLTERRQKGEEKYKAPSEPDTSNLPELPDGWVWATFEQLGAWIGGGTPSKRNPEYWNIGNVPWVSPKDMKSQLILDSKDKITEKAIKESTAKLICHGAVLFVVRSGILRRTLPIALTKVDVAVNQDIKALSACSEMEPEYVLYSALARAEEIRHKCQKDGTTVESIEVPALQAFPVAVPSREEQQAIIQEIESRLSVAEEVERTVDANLKRAERLRQSILKQAFSGKLV